MRLAEVVHDVTSPSLLTPGMLVDEELAAKLESELQLEQEMQDPDEVPLSISDFLNNSPFTVSFLFRMVSCWTFRGPLT